MKTKIVKEKEQETVLSKKNYIILIIGSIFMGHRTKRILRIERKEYQTY